MGLGRREKVGEGKDWHRQGASTSANMMEVTRHKSEIFVFIEACETSCI
jgi:hypothetical protein